MTRMRTGKLIAAVTAVSVLIGGGVVALTWLRASSAAGEVRPLDETLRTDELVVRYSADFTAERLGPNAVLLSRNVVRPLHWAGVETISFDRLPLGGGDGTNLRALSEGVIDPGFAKSRANGDRIDHIEGRAATCSGRPAWETTAIEEGPLLPRRKFRACVFVRGESVFLVAYHVPADLAERDEHVLHRIAEAFEPTAPAAPTATPGRDPATSDNDRVVASLRSRFRACYQDGLNKDPTVEGGTTIAVSIAPDGRVRSVTPSQTPDAGVLPDEVTECIASALRNATFSTQAATGTTLHVPVRFVPHAR